MKKILTTLLAASMMLAGTSVFAQNLAVEAGFGLSSTRFNYTLGSTTADLYGGTLGLSYEIPVVEGTIGFAPGIQVGYFTGGYVNLPFNLGKASFNESYLAVPLDLNLHLPISEDMKFLIVAGPTLDLGLTSRAKLKDTSAEYDIYDGALGDMTKYNRFDVLIGGGLGLDVMDAVRFTVRYDYGLINRNGGNLTSGFLKVHRSQLKLGVGFLF
ncbi:MAG: PorT family protein [Bacteroidales bacterium]|nr:PorT family protein [Bacteroidales bacterium]